MMKAQAIPWSSIVGTGIILRNEQGAVIGQLTLLNVPDKETATDIVQHVVERINDPSRQRIADDRFQS